MRSQSINYQNRFQEITSEFDQSLIEFKSKKKVKISIKNEIAKSNFVENNISRIVLHNIEEMRKKSSVDRLRVSNNSYFSDSEEELNIYDS